MQWCPRAGRWAGSTTVYSRRRATPVSPGGFHHGLQPTPRDPGVPGRVPPRFTADAARPRAGSTTVYSRRRATPVSPGGRGQFW